MKVLIPAGTRPELIKLAPIVHALRASGVQLRVVATGQHYDVEMVDVLDGPLTFDVDVRWELPSDRAERLGALTANAHRELAATDPDLVVVLGDTHTVPVFCLAARAARRPVVHVEAGLRSFNETSTEEVNRLTAAAAASLHLAPTEAAARLLRRRGVAAERVRVVGNPIIDVLRLSGIRPVEPEQRTGAVFTAHRATNVDDPDRLRTLVAICLDLAESHAPVVFPLHPRTQSRLERDGLDRPLRDHAGVRLSPPLAYRDMLAALAAARIIVTDSGGIQEEAAWLGVPTVVLRHSTPRWEGVHERLAVLTGVDRDRVARAVAAMTRPDELARVAAAGCPYGDGHTADRIAELLTAPGLVEELAPREPDFVDRPPPI